MPPCPPYSTQWSNDINALPHPHIYTGEVPHYGGTSTASPISPLTSLATHSNNCPSTSNPGLGGDAFRELASMGDSLIQECPSQSTNQPLYYVATGKFVITERKSFCSEIDRKTRSCIAPDSPSDQYNVTSIQSNRACSSRVPSLIVHAAVSNEFNL
jgi:hypothetical protein